MWASLGIDNRSLAVRPLPQSYPRVFSQRFLPLWEQALEAVPDAAPVLDQWDAALAQFIELCRQQGVSPFKNMMQSQNDFIVSYLRSSRRAVVKFLNEAKPFDLMTLKAVKRVCEIDETGTLIRVIGEVRSADPTIGRWLLKRPWPAMQLKSNGVYRKQLTPNTTMVIFNEGAALSQRWRIGYEIRVPLRPVLDDPLATKTDLELFVLKVLWYHVMTGQRGRVWHRRQL